MSVHMPICMPIRMSKNRFESEPGQAANNMYEMEQVCTHVYTHVCTHTFTHVCTRDASVCMFVHMSANTYLYKLTCLHTHLCTCHMHVYAHAYTYTQAVESWVDIGYPIVDVRHDGVFTVQASTNARTISLHTHPLGRSPACMHAGAHTQARPPARTCAHMHACAHAQTCATIVQPNRRFEHAPKEKSNL